MTPRSRFRRWAVLTGALVLALPSAAASQTDARVTTEENFRRVPNGEVLARLEVDAPLRVVGSDGSWREVVMEGWVWTRSLQVVDQGGFDLVVAASGGENLRAEPSGQVLARLGEGTLLEELERRPGWIRARRTGWVWAPSLEVGGATTSPTSDGAATPSAAPEPAPGPASRRPEGVARSGPSGAAVLGAPDGDTLARAVAGSELEVVGRQGNWARVRLEGWTWLPDEAGGASADAAEGDAPLTPADLMADPRAYRGRVVTWSVQFISLEEAERVRTDFFEGEPFLLTRYGGPDGPFVYVAVAPERLARVEGLTPLEPLTIVGRVRTGASALTGTPILDLMTLSRDGGDR